MSTRAKGAIGLHTDLNEQTKHMMSDREFAMMRTDVTDGRPEFDRRISWSAAPVPVAMSTPPNNEPSPQVISPEVLPSLELYAIR